MLKSSPFFDVIRIYKYQGGHSHEKENRSICIGIALHTGTYRLLLLGIPDFEGDLSFVYNLEFGNAGDMSLMLQIGDEDSFMEAIILASVASTYAELEAQNISKEEADAAMEQEFGMDVEAYMRATMENISMNDLLASVFSAIDLGGVYYVENGQIYAGSDWNAEMDPSDFSLDGDQLIIDSLSTSLGFDAVFIRATE